ncbi:MAG TPA: AlpA family phage regulatory protein [Variovorax sp.]|nr:AlpA family phage regulatory protein [Variovorax sp.]
MSSATILLRKPSVMSRTGFGNTMLYRRISDGLFTRPVRIGALFSAGPASEVEKLNCAIVAGRNADEIRTLVQSLEQARTAELKNTAPA